MKKNNNEFRPKLPSPEWSTFSTTPTPKTKTKPPKTKKKKSPNKSENSSFLGRIKSAKRNLKPVKEGRRTNSLIKIAQKRGKAPEPPKKKSPIGTKTRKTSDSKEEYFEKLREILEGFYRGKGKKSSSSRSSVNSSSRSSVSSNNSNTWFKSPVGSSLSSMNSSPKAKSRRVRFRRRDSETTVSRYPQKRTSSNDKAYNTNKKERELKQFKKEINANRDRYGEDLANDVDALDMASVNFGINFQSVIYNLRDNEFIKFKSKYPELFREKKISY